MSPVASAGAGAADVATLVTRFADRLRAAGVAVSPDQTMRLAALIGLGVARTRDELYWCARVSLVRSGSDVPAFDAVFAQAFGAGGVVPRPGPAAEPPGVRADRPRPARGTVRQRAGGRFEPDDATGAARQGRPVPTLASSEERLTVVDFAELGRDELDALAPLLQLLAVHTPLRVSRRRRRHRRGDRLDLRASLRRAVRSGGDPAAAVRRTRRRRPRRLVALLDVSGSMEPYARAYLHLLWGAASRADAEVFVFGTRLTRLTRVLRTGDPDRALARAAALMPDWSGGTRIGASVREFMDGHGRRGMAHGAVVLVVSDGWERDDPTLLATQMAALASRAHRVVWANPRSAAPGFEPLTGGMRAALPHVDALVSGHSAEALADVVRALGDQARSPQGP
ncbi:VWA domain-containing protein [Isoptericola hypogeus]|uniref:VWA domain-containing protein n=1 Tax=Isoptericola hypogeus TaxID=300179 RepID=A0ABP4VZR0_9MICO